MQTCWKVYAIFQRDMSIETNLLIILMFYINDYSLDISSQLGSLLAIKFREKVWPIYIFVKKISVIKKEQHGNTNKYKY